MVGMAVAKIIALDGVPIVEMAVGGCNAKIIKPKILGHLYLFCGYLFGIISVLKYNLYYKFTFSSLENKIYMEILN